MIYLNFMEQDNLNNEAIGLSGWVIKYSGGLIKDEKQANSVLIWFVAAAIIVVLVLVFENVGGPKTPSPESYANKQQFLPKE